MKLGISIDVDNFEIFKKHLNAAAEAGYEYCQLFYRDDDLTEARAKEIKQMCDDKNVKIGPVGGYISGVKPEERTMNFDLDKLFNLIDLMPILGSKEVLIWSGTFSDVHMFHPDEKNQTDEAFEKLTETCGNILDKLASINGELAIETFFTHVIHDEKTFLKLKEKLNNNRLKVVMDPPNYMTVPKFNEEKETLTNLFKTMQNDISMIHFKDIKRRDDESWPFDYPGPGDGEMNYPHLMKLIEQFTPNVWGIIEHVGPDEFKKAKSFLDKQMQVNA